MKLTRANIAFLTFCVGLLMCLGGGLYLTVNDKTIPAWLAMIIAGFTGISGLFSKEPGKKKGEPTKDVE